MPVVVSGGPPEGLTDAEPKSAVAFVVECLEHSKSALVWRLSRQICGTHALLGLDCQIILIVMFDCIGRQRTPVPMISFPSWFAAMN